jgi:hypothetical protein
MSHNAWSCVDQAEEHCHCLVIQAHTIDLVDLGVNPTIKELEWSAPRDS